MVLHVLLKRIARARGKAFKHALYVLYRVRPVEYQRLAKRAVERSRPKRCPECGSKALSVRAVADLWWDWQCEDCGACGITRHEGIASLFLG